MDDNVRFEDVLTPIRFTYSDVSREGYVIGIHRTREDGSLLIEVMEAYNDRDGLHDGLRFKRFRAEDIHDIVRPK